MRKANKKTIAAAMAILQMFGMGLTMSVSAEEIELIKEILCRGKSRYFGKFICIGILRALRKRTGSKWRNAFY